MIEQSYLTFRRDLNRFAALVLSETDPNGNEVVLHLPETSELDPHHQIQFSANLGYYTHTHTHTREITVTFMLQKFFF